MGKPVGATDYRTRVADVLFSAIDVELTEDLEHALGLEFGSVAVKRVNQSSARVTFEDRVFIVAVLEA